MRLVVLGYDETAARFFVESMHDARPFLAANPGEVWAMMQQRVDERVFPVPGAGMNDQTGGFIDYDEIVILEKNVERDCLREIVDLLDRWLGQLDRVTGTDEITRPRGFAIESNKSASNELLQARPRMLGQLIGQKAVEPIAGGCSGNG
jgi:hypothetical protein